MAPSEAVTGHPRGERRALGRASKYFHSETVTAPATLLSGKPRDTTLLADKIAPREMAAREGSGSGRPGKITHLAYRCQKEANSSRKSAWPLQTRLVTFPFLLHSHPPPTPVIDPLLAAVLGLCP